MKKKNQTEESARKELGMVVGLFNRLNGKSFTVSEAMKNEDFIALFEKVKTVIQEESKEIQIQKAESNKRQSLDKVDIGEKQKIILETLKKNPNGLTRRQLETKTGLFLQTILGRCSELKDMGLIYAAFDTKCKETGRNVEVLKIMPTKKKRG